MGMAAVLFVVLLSLEALVLARRGRRRMRLDETLSAVGCALLDQLVNAVTLAGFVVVYELVRERAGLITLSPRSVVGWVACALAHDLAYYVFHRASHRVSVLWAAHEVHHQSESYNLTVSLRQGAVATVVSYAFYLPLALVGFPVAMFLGAHLVYQVYQFVVHTEQIRTLGPLERWLATPSHHRVHHGVDAEHIDRNYGGLLIVWDRWFGTFTPERQRPRYGVPDRLASWSPLHANLDPYRRLARRCLASKDGWLPVLLGPPRSHEARTPSVFDAPDRVTERVYLLAQSAVTAMSTLVWLREREPPSNTAGALSLAALLAAVLATGAWLDRRRWARAAEVTRLAITALTLAAWQLTHGPRPGLIALTLWVVLSLVWLRRRARV